MSDSYDIVVVGGGSKSLTAAAYMAKIGKKVAVLEKNQHCGGGVVSCTPAPGFIGDPHATGMVICLMNPTISHDELELEKKFGLQWAYTEATFATIFDDDAGLITWYSPNSCGCMPNGSVMPTTDTTGLSKPSMATSKSAASSSWTPTPPGIPYTMPNSYICGWYIMQKVKPNSSRTNIN